jgi:hypothetical protein
MGIDAAAMRMSAGNQTKGAPIKEAPPCPPSRRYSNLSTLISCIADAIIAFGLLST